MLEDHFGPEVASHYDAAVADMFNPAVLAAELDMLAGLAGSAGALEFAIGTGRVALPLAARGVRVAGIDLSEAMVQQLRAKPGGQDLQVVIGDMADDRVPGSYGLVYLVFNTIGNLTTQEQQVACFANAAAHLQPGGSFVIELGVPELRRLPLGERHVLQYANADQWGYDEYDTAAQRLTSHHLRQDGTRVHHNTVPFRYVWPAELDLMARLAGLTLSARWCDWHRQPFEHDSTSHVSVWRKD